MNNIQPIWADDYLIAISQSKIGLNLSQGKPAKYYSSDRFSQLIGNGLLVMIDEKTRIGNFFNKDEIVMYDSISDLSEKRIAGVFIKCPTFLFRSKALPCNLIDLPDEEI